MIKYKYPDAEIAKVAGLDALKILERHVDADPQ